MRNYERLMHDGPGEDVDNDSYYTQRVGNTGKTQAQLDAYQNAIEVAEMINSTDGAGKAVMDKDTGILTHIKPIVPPVIPPKKLVVQSGVSPSNKLSTSGSITAIPSTPITPVTKTPPRPPAKTASIDTVLFDDDSMSIEIMADLIFENIGGHELINIARNDIINGQQISYTPIKNLGLIQQQYNPNNILGLQATSDKYFANFAIKFEEKVPTVGNGPNGANVYLDDNTGDLIIEGVNMNKDELFEVEISVNGTIYTADFGATTS